MGYKDRMVFARPIILATLCHALFAGDIAPVGLTGGTYRFKDVGGQAFSQNLIDTFNYPASNVSISFDTPGVNHLAGLITATGLKPNFAYQIKLIGNPSKNATSDADRAAADDATNEKLGSMGRWWRIAPNAGNTNDADYNQNKDNPASIYEGYLVIGFFVTDASGNANVRFEGKNSFHVLWRTDQRAPAPNDGPILPVNVAATTGNAAYDIFAIERNYSLYGEWEPTRALPNALIMPNGRYRCRLMLTEESFHDFGALAGNWSAALAAPIDFDIPFALRKSDQPNVDPPVSTLPLDVTALRLDIDFDRELRDKGSINGMLTLPREFNPDKLEVQTTVLGTEQKFILDKRGRAVTKQGTLELRGPKKGQTHSSLKWRSKKLSYVLQASELPALQTVTVYLKFGADTWSGTAAPQQRSSAHRVTLKFKN